MADDLSEVWNPYTDDKDDNWNRVSFFSRTPVLNDGQLIQAKERALETQIENLEYLNKHPEIRALIRVLFTEIVEVKPIDVEDFFRNFFNRGIDLLEKLVGEQVKDFPVTESRRQKHGGRSSVAFMQPSMAATNLGMLRSASYRTDERKVTTSANTVTSHSVSIVLGSRELVMSDSDGSLTRISQMSSRLTK